MATNDDFNEDKEHMAVERERDHYENLTGTRGAGDPDTYGYPSEAVDTKPVELPEAEF